MRLGILLAEDDQYARQMIRSLLKVHTRYQIVSEARNGKEACELAIDTKPDVILMDAAMPVMDGVEATRRILARDPSARILALSTHDEPVWIRSMFEAGAKGFILKQSGIEILRAAIEAVAAGKYFTDPAVITDVVTRDYVRQLGSGGKTPADVLTPRQHEVLRHIGEGCSSKDIADRLGVSTRMVDKHRRDIMTALSLKSPAELVVYAVKTGQSFSKLSSL